MWSDKIIYINIARLISGALRFVAIGVYFVTAFLIACCEALRRTRPFNFIFSVLFTLNLGLLLGMLATLYQSDELLVAVGLTSAVCLTLLLFVFQTRCAFTGAGPYLFCVLIPLIFFGLMAVMLHRGLLGLLFSSLTVMLFSCYLVYDTQLMIRGKYDHSLIADDYVILGLGIYLNIVIIFMKILWMLKRKIV
ncbi:Protein lifeguard 1 [Eumeta japonica]|uniref:Protein lifeguard 1 n=1 Tax=Eumeta variegata TaxID=151549 RepID=A0A4C1T3Q6_EUMVA|nr:Protein lifeguard 1 [Eumeta japonica]